MKRLLLCCAVSGVLGGAVTTWLVEPQPDWSFGPSAAAQGLGTLADARPTTTANTAVAPPTGLTPEEQTNIRVYENTNRGVVNILTRSDSYEGFFMLPSHDEGAGSGSVLDKRGHILTNNHVIEDAEVVLVTLPGAQQPYPAEVVGTDVSTDIAVLKIDAPASELHPITLGTSDNLKVGQRVYTLGNPFGFNGTLTTGIISNLNRTLPSRSRGREMKSIIQTDAPMNPGNSGGPLLDTSGRMVGMNVAIASMSGQNSGLGFAIPANRIRQIVPHLIKNGKVVRADIGIVAVNEIDEGLQIVRINKGGPADKAGLRGWGIVRRRVNRGPIAYNVQQEDRTQADIIVGIDGKQLKSASDFIDTIEEHRPGDKITLSIIRGGQLMQVEVTLGAA
jgi:S1-C subfamily serine protease